MRVWFIADLANIIPHIISKSGNPAGTWTWQGYEQILDSGFRSYPDRGGFEPPRWNCQWKPGRYMDMTGSWAKLDSGFSPCQDRDMASYYYYYYSNSLFRYFQGVLTYEILRIVVSYALYGGKKYEKILRVLGTRRIPKMCFW